MILLVDDDESFIQSNKDLLEAYGYEVHAASNGSEGIKMAEALKPDLMILDVMMATDTEGFEVARKIRDNRELSKMPIILVTGVMTAMGIPKTLVSDRKWLPVDRVLEKPISPSILVNEVQRILKAR